MHFPMLRCSPSIALPRKSGIQLRGRIRFGTGRERRCRRRAWGRPLGCGRPRIREHYCGYTDHARGSYRHHEHHDRDASGCRLGPRVESCDHACGSHVPVNLRRTIPQVLVDARLAQRIETRFAISYRATNWRPLGCTVGYARRPGPVPRWPHHGQPKEVFVYELEPDARARLAGLAAPAEHAAHPVRLPLHHAGVPQGARQALSAGHPACAGRRPQRDRLRAVRRPAEPGAAGGRGLLLGPVPCAPGALGWRARPLARHCPLQQQPVAATPDHECAPLVDRSGHLPLRTYARLPTTECSSRTSRSGPRALAASLRRGPRNAGDCRCLLRGSKSVSSSPATLAEPPSIVKRLPKKSYSPAPPLPNLQLLLPDPTGTQAPRNTTRQPSLLALDQPVKPRSLRMLSEIRYPRQTRSTRSMGTASLVQCPARV